MKKVTSIFLLLLFFLGTTGMPLNAHFCGDMLASLSLATQEVDDSNCCGDKDDCCSDQEVKIDVDDDYLDGSNKELHNNVSPATVNHEIFFDFWHVCNVEILRNFSNYAPPDYIQSNTFQVLHCSFLI